MFSTPFHPYYFSWSNLTIFESQDNSKNYSPWPFSNQTYYSDFIYCLNLSNKDRLLCFGFRCRMTLYTHFDTMGVEVESLIWCVCRYYNNFKTDNWKSKICLNMYLYFHRWIPYILNFGILHHWSRTLVFHQIILPQRYFPFINV